MIIPQEYSELFQNKEKFVSTEVSLFYGSIGSYKSDFLLSLSNRMVSHSSIAYFSLSGSRLSSFCDKTSSRKIIEDNEYVTASSISSYVDSILMKQDFYKEESVSLFVFDNIDHVLAEGGTGAFKFFKALKKLSSLNIPIFLLVSTGRTKNFLDQESLSSIKKDFLSKYKLKRSLHEYVSHLIHIDGEKKDNRIITKCRFSDNNSEKELRFEINTDALDYNIRNVSASWNRSRFLGSC